MYKLCLKSSKQSTTRFVGGMVFTVLAKTTAENRQKEEELSEFGSKKKQINLQEHYSDSLSRSHLIQAASGQLVDSVSTLLTQVTLALIEAEREYTELMKILVHLMEKKLSVLDSEPQEQNMWDLILECRSQLRKAFQKQQDLNLLMASVVKVVDATAEVAFLAGAEEASTIAGERLHSAQCHIQQLQRQTQEAEKLLMEMEAHTVTVTARHAEEKAKTMAESPTTDKRDPIPGNKAQILPDFTELKDTES